MIESNVILVITVVFMVIFQNPIASAAGIVGSEDQFQSHYFSSHTLGVTPLTLCILQPAEDNDNFPLTSTPVIFN